jgi:hypothetical protein
MKNITPFPQEYHKSSVINHVEGNECNCCSSNLVENCTEIKEHHSTQLKWALPRAWREGDKNNLHKKDGFHQIRENRCPWMRKYHGRETIDLPEGTLCPGKVPHRKNNSWKTLDRMLVQIPHRPILSNRDTPKLNSLGHIYIFDGKCSTKHLNSISLEGRSDKV